MGEDDYLPWASETHGAHAVNRAAVIMRILAISGAQGLSLGEISAHARLPKSTVHRLLAALVDERLAERARLSRRYRLGMEILALAAAAGPKHDLRGLSRHALEEIARDTGHVAHLMIRSGYDIVCLDQVCLAPSASMIGRLGTRAPLGVGANSLALLSRLDDDEIADVMAQNSSRLADHPVFGPEQIMSGVRQARRLGHCVYIVQRNPRVFGVGVPILASNRRPLAAIGVTTVSGAPLNEEETISIATRLKAEAEHIAREYEAAHDRAEHAWISAGR